MSLIVALLLGLTRTQAAADSVGQPVDIAPSAYTYRADRKPGANAPESWIAVAYAAGLPINKPIDRANPAVNRILEAYLWEEIRPIQTLELTWPATAKHLPKPEEIKVTALINQGASSSWWNNLKPEVQDSKARVTNQGRTYSIPLGINACGLVISVADGVTCDAPEARVLVPDIWKQMDVEVEWGFDVGRTGQDYSGYIESYDGRISNLKPLEGDPTTKVSPWYWSSTGRSAKRRGIQMSLLYMGSAKWRKYQEYTTQPDDVARTIVTIWTKSGSFSFRAADLENGPILAPEYGFFVRRTNPFSPGQSSKTAQLRPIPRLIDTKMTSVVGDRRLTGWGTDETPVVAANPTDEKIEAQGITFPPHHVCMHPGQFTDVAVVWRCQIAGDFEVHGSLTHRQSGSKGIEWWIAADSATDRRIVGHGTTDGSSKENLIFGTPGLTQPGDRISLIIGNKGDYRCCTTDVDLNIAQQHSAHMKWNLANDVNSDLTLRNPHPDSLNIGGTWSFCSELPMATPALIPSQPPIDLESRATSARDFEAELSTRGYKSVRLQTHEHPEQTWLGAVTSTRGQNLPPHPTPPAGQEPPMKVDVPDKRLIDQWNLGVWHLIRHCEKNPVTGKLWFNDFPYGILAAETYLVLSVLDQMGAHEAASNGFDQWLSLPMDRPAPNDHPVGRFTDGHGALNGATGPAGLGGDMDVIHAFGPGSIGWAMMQHYWLTGDKTWLKANAPRIRANVEWILNQRKAMSNVMPGGNRLWCKGLQPALQVTPDSGGLWMQFYECEAYYCSAVTQFADALSTIDPKEGALLQKEAKEYRDDLRKAVERSIALSPVIPTRDGTYHSVIPFACYVRGPATGAWGWQRDGSGTHVGQLYWDTVQSAAALISPAGLLSPIDPRVQGYFDVLEDRFLLENHNVGDRNWFSAGWQYQGGLERQANMYLAADDIPVFIRSFLNCYAVDILPNQGYTFNEHAVHGPPDKIFEEAAFLERFRNLLVMEEGDRLWIAKGTPREWLESGKHIAVVDAPTRFGNIGYRIESQLDRGIIHVEVDLPKRAQPKEILLRLRHPKSTRMRSVTVNGKPWSDFDQFQEVVKLHGLTGPAAIDVNY